MKRIVQLVVLAWLTTFSTYGQMEVMTYNIKYANESDGENSWSNRKDHLANQLRFYQPDLFGVQEAFFEQLEFLKEQLPAYEFSGIGRDGGRKGEHSAIFYDTKQFKLLKEGTFWLSETPDKVSKGWDASYARIVSYALFERKGTGKKFWVFNTHFDHIGEIARRESSRLVTRKIGAINQEGLSVILMGDFNLEPVSEEIQFLSTQFEDAKKSANLVFGPEGTYNGYDFTAPVSKRIDYIFLSEDDFKVEKYAVLSDSKDLRYPSDHLPVLIQVNL